VAQSTPDAGVVSATGQFSWPTSGSISQRYVWYHKALDISNKGGPAILAADSGRVTVAGWPDNFGYGNRVIINHGNGFETLYAHMSSIAVSVGQTVNRGDVLGVMGSTGRSTGTHLHFEIRQNGATLDPLGFLR
jgi:murein DD-endopeptidase MepM/ murein hydrolase activator NlpD